MSVEKNNELQRKPMNPRGRTLAGSDAVQQWDYDPGRLKVQGRRPLRGGAEGGRRPLRGGAEGGRRPLRGGTEGATPTEGRGQGGRRPLRGGAGTTAPYGPAETQRKGGAAPCSRALIRPRPGPLGSAQLRLQLAGRLRPAALRPSEGVGLWWRGTWLRGEGLAPPWRRAYVARHLRPPSCVSALRG
ncbi:unnamed protein product [Arctogadus glacialis]